MAKKKSQKSNKRIIFWTTLSLAAILGVICAAKTYSQNNYTAVFISKNEGPNTSNFDFSNQKFSINGRAIASDFSHMASVSISRSGLRGAVILRDQPGGSGTFYYLVGATKKDNQISYSQPMLLGDRLKISSMTVNDPEAHDNGEIVVEYIDRSANTPLGQKPSIKKTVKYAFQDDSNLIEVLH